MKRYNKQRYYHFLLSLLLLSISTTVVVNSQSIQGYIYWDTNANGVLDTGLSSSSNGVVGSSDNDKSELENGIIDVTVQVHSCYATTSDDNDGKFLDAYTSFLLCLPLLMSLTKLYKQTILTPHKNATNNAQQYKTVITKGITLWPQTYQDEYERITGHSAIYPYGGYYILDLSDANSEVCICFRLDVYFRCVFCYVFVNGWGLQC